MQSFGFSRICAPAGNAILNLLTDSTQQYFENQEKHIKKWNITNRLKFKTLMTISYSCYRIISKTVMNKTMTCNNFFCNIVS